MTKENKKAEIQTESKEQEATSLDIAKELQSLRDELEKLRKEKRSFSDAEQDAIEEARDSMITDDELGPLYIDEKFKDDAYVYRIVDSSRRGRVEKHLKRGYEIVYDDTIVGDKTVTNNGSLTGAVTVGLAESKQVDGVLMRIPREKYNARQKAKVKFNQEQTDAMAQDGVNKSHFGSIEIGSDVYKK